MATILSPLTSTHPPASLSPLIRTDAESNTDPTIATLFVDALNAALSMSALESITQKHASGTSTHAEVIPTAGLIVARGWLDDAPLQTEVPVPLPHTDVQPLLVTAKDAVFDGSQSCESIDKKNIESFQFLPSVSPRSTTLAIPPVRPNFKHQPAFDSSREELIQSRLDSPTSAGVLANDADWPKLSLSSPSRQHAHSHHQNMQTIIGSDTPSSLERSSSPMRVIRPIKSSADLSVISSLPERSDMSFRRPGSSDLREVAQNQHDASTAYFSADIWSSAFPRAQHRSRAASVSGDDRFNPVPVRGHLRRISTLSAPGSIAEGMEEFEEGVDNLNQYRNANARYRAQSRGTQRRHNSLQAVSPVPEVDTETDTTLFGMFSSATKAIFGPLNLATQPFSSALSASPEPPSPSSDMYDHEPPRAPPKHPFSSTAPRDVQRPPPIITDSPGTTRSLSSSLSSTVATPGARYFAPSDEHHGEEFHGHGHFVRRKTKGWAYGVDAASNYSGDRRGDDSEVDAEMEPSVDDDEVDSQLGEDEEEDMEEFSRTLREMFDTPSRQSLDEGGQTTDTGEHTVFNSVANLAMSLGFGFGGTGTIDSDTPTGHASSTLPPTPSRASSSTSILTVMSAPAPRRGLDLHRPIGQKHHPAPSNSSIRSDLAGYQYQIPPPYGPHRRGLTSRSEINVPITHDIVGTRADHNLGSDNEDNGTCVSTAVSTSRSINVSGHPNRWSVGSAGSGSSVGVAVAYSGPVPAEFSRLGVFVDVGEVMAPVGAGRDGKKLGKWVGGGFTSYSVTVKLLRPDIPLYNNQSAVTFMLRKRYREFRSFYETLLVLYPHIRGWPEFPKKSFFDRFSSTTLHHRHTLFTHFLHFVALHPTLYNCPATRAFLGVSAREVRHANGSFGRGVGGGVVFFERKRESGEVGGLVGVRREV